MRVQLINPPAYLNPKAMSSIKPTLPMGLAYIASAIREAGHEVVLLDAMALAPTAVRSEERLQVVGATPEELVERIDPAAQVVGITSTFTFTWPLVADLAHRIKQRRPDKIIVVGGENATGMPDHCFKTAPIDFLVLGEGEATARELLDALAAGKQDCSDIPGLAFRRNGNVVYTPRRDRIEDVDAIPWPAWDLFDVHAYYKQHWLYGPDAGMTIPILATRGCPYACTFCSSATMWSRKWRARDPRRVVDEIEHYMKTYGAVNFPLQDHTVVLQKEWMIEFCREILRRGLIFSWQVYGGTRPEVIDDEVATLMRRAGAQTIAFAPESGSARTRDLIGKQMSEDALMEAVRASVRAGLRVSVFFVLGFPHDTWDDIRESIRLCRKLAIHGVEDIAAGYYFPIPGTPLFDHLEAGKRLEYNAAAVAAPLFTTSLRLADEYNYCESLSARRLSHAKILMVLNFYLLYYALRPWRAAAVLWHVLRGRETSRLEIYLNFVKHRLISRGA